MRQRTNLSKECVIRGCGFICWPEIEGKGKAFRFCLGQYQVIVDYADKETRIYHYHNDGLLVIAKLKETYLQPDFNDLDYLEKLELLANG